MARKKKNPFAICWAMKKKYGFSHKKWKDCVNDIKHGKKRK